VPGDPTTALIVLDTNVLVAGACRQVGSAAYRLLMHVLSGRVPLVITQPILMEYEDVLSRPAVRRLTGLSPGQTRDLILLLLSRSYKTQTRFSWRPNLRDEDDNRFVEAAIHSAAIIVTYNHADFCSPDLVPYGWAVMSPREFLIQFDLED
jgi:putative PIN family toxin of toxin-antitoxin system